ncbi:hypothetical protein [Leptospira alstonii]|nr:hypothetical protein [Leptospira alstonii]
MKESKINLSPIEESKLLPQQSSYRLIKRYNDRLDYQDNYSQADYLVYPALHISNGSKRTFRVTYQSDFRMNNKQTGLVWAWFGLAFTNPALYPGAYIAVYGSSFLAPVIFGFAIYNYKTEVNEIQTGTKFEIPN